MHNLAKKILQFYIRRERRFYFRRLQKEIDFLISRNSDNYSYRTKKVKHYPNCWGKGYQVIGEELYRDIDGRLRPINELKDDKKC